VVLAARAECPGISRATIAVKTPAPQAAPATIHRVVVLSLRSA
jgi:hypothetical protein